MFWIPNQNLPWPWSLQLWIICPRTLPASLSSLSFEHRFQCFMFIIYLMLWRWHFFWSCLRHRDCDFISSVTIYTFFYVFVQRIFLLYCVVYYSHKYTLRITLCVCLVIGYSAPVLKQTFQKLSKTFEQFHLNPPQPQPSHCQLKYKYLPYKEDGNVKSNIQIPVAKKMLLPGFKFFS